MCFIEEKINDFAIIDWRRFNFCEIKSLNKFHKINSNGFQGLNNLEELNLNSNKLAKIESNLFQHLNKLKILS